MVNGPSLAEPWKLASGELMLGLLPDPWKVTTVGVAEVGLDPKLNGSLGFD